MRHLAHAEIKAHTILSFLSNAIPKVVYFLTTIFGSIYHDRKHVTSNRPPEDWVALFPDPVMANSALDRLSHHAHHIMIDGGDSYRKKLSPKARQ